MEVLWIVSLFMMQSLLVLAQLEGGEEVACEHQSNSLLQLSCPEGQVIKIKSAVYGRQSTEYCTNHASKMSNLNCAAENSLAIVADTCTGEASCSIEAANSVFGDPCKGTTKYIMAKYECVAVKTEPAGAQNKAALGGHCTNLGSPCAAENSVCRNYHCKCRHGKGFVKGGDTCVAQSTLELGAGCSDRGEPCAAENSVCRRFSCRCKKGFVKQGDSCVDAETLTDSEVEDTLLLAGRCSAALEGSPCSAANSVCRKERCKCKKGYTKENGEDNCMAQDTLELAAFCTKHGEPCAADNSVCRNRHCKCRNNFIMEGDTCVSQSTKSKARSTKSAPATETESAKSTKSTPESEPKSDYKDLKCWRNKIPQQMTKLEGTNDILDGNYKQREDAINKCFLAAKEDEYDWFAVGNKGQCWAGNGDKYKHYGAVEKCPENGKGYYGVTHVYMIAEEEETVTPAPGLGLGARCQPNRGPPCEYPNTSCIAYRCKCVRYWVRSGQTCVAQTTLPLAARCTTLYAPCADANSECSAYRCFCKAGTIKIGNACLVPSGY